MLLTEILTEEEIIQYRENPDWYVEDIIGATPTEQQREVLQALPESNAIAVKSGHGTGKTALESWVITWFLTLYPESRIACTAPTGHQLEDLLWPELNKWANRAINAGDYVWTKTRFAIQGYEETWFAVPRSSNKPDNMQGFHADHLIFIIDEASGVPQEILEVVEGALTSEGAKLLMCGNPTQLSGTFFNAFHKDRALFQTFTFSSLDSPNVSQDYAERMGKKYGEDSDVYRVRVLGLFPKGSPDTLIRLDTVEAAVSREVNAIGKFFIGVDPARFGDDESVIFWRHGYDVKPARGFHGIDTSRLTGEVAALIKDIRKGYQYNGRIHVRVDETGIGAGVFDQLNLQKEELNIDLIPVNFGGSGNDDYTDLGSRIWGDVKERIPDLSLPDDDDLVAQLTTRKYMLMPDGRIKLEKKGDMKKRGLASPDRADALALCVANLNPPKISSQKTDTKPVTAGLRNERF